MGLCPTKEEREQDHNSKRIDKELKKQPANLQQKMLLLGPGESGKSTTLKQMQLLHTSGFTKAEIEEKKFIVYQNVLSNIVLLIDQAEYYNIKFGDAHLKEQAEYIRKCCQSNKVAYKIDHTLKTAIKCIWEDKGIQETYNQRADFQFTESAAYFFDDIDRIARDDYQPTNQDILHTRVATTGVVQVSFCIKNINVEVYDVGGQRSERRKWIHCFDDVNAIIFVAAISEYDQKIREDNKSNRLMEALALFDGVASAKFFEKTAYILFLNKIDLFKEKIVRVSLKTCFPNYKGGLNYKDGIEAIRNEFKKKEKPERKYYLHETCATDTTQIQVIINSVIDTIIQENLRDTGMI